MALGDGRVGMVEEGQFVLRGVGAAQTDVPSSPPTGTTTWCSPRWPGPSGSPRVPPTTTSTARQDFPGRRRRGPAGTGRASRNRGRAVRRPLGAPPGRLPGLPGRRDRLGGAANPAPRRADRARLGQMASPGRSLLRQTPLGGPASTRRSRDHRRPTGGTPDPAALGGDERDRALDRTRRGPTRR